MKKQEQDDKIVVAGGMSKELEVTIKSIQSKYGEGSIMKLGDARKVAVDVLSTGSISLDLALGVGGMPRGRIIEIYGPESSGKTTLALHIVSEAQKRGEAAAFVDTEHALDPEYSAKIGVKIDDLLISQPDNGEQALDIVESLVRSGSVGVIVVDSVAALTPKSEIEGEMGATQVAVQARLMSHAMRKLTPLVAKARCILIFTNQIRMMVGVMFGNPETTPGGKALKFYSSVRLEVRRSAQIKKDDQIIGNRIKAKIVKNKVAAPFKLAEFDILYNEGISGEADLLNTGVKYGVVSKAGTWFVFEGEKLGQGMETARNFLKANPSKADAIRQKILMAAQVLPR